MDKFYMTSYDIDTIRAEAANSAISYSNNGANLSDMSFALVLDSETTVRLFLKPASGYTGSFTVTVDGVDADAVLQSNGFYRVELVNIPAHALSRTHTVIVTTGSGSATIRFSALSYVSILFRAYSSADAQNAAAALWAYSKAADEFNAK
jgi:hypothetical protein